jgi:hypothetical protein
MYPIYNLSHSPHSAPPSWTWESIAPPHQIGPEFFQFAPLTPTAHLVLLRKGPETSALPCSQNICSLMQNRYHMRQRKFRQCQTKFKGTLRRIRRTYWLHIQDMPCSSVPLSTKRKVTIYLFFHSAPLSLPVSENGVTSMAICTLHKLNTQHLPQETESRHYDILRKRSVQR